MHLLRVDWFSDILQAPFKLGLDRRNHAREVAKLPPAEFDGRQRRSVRGLVPRAWRVLAGPERYARTFPAAARATRRPAFDDDCAWPPCSWRRLRRGLQGRPVAQRLCSCVSPSHARVEGSVQRRRSWRTI